MEQDSFSTGIIGAGPAGCCCAYFLKKFCPELSISVIDKSDFLRTILPTGARKCNLTNYEFDLHSLVKNYPRGEKFLYSVFSSFSVGDTLEFFNELDIETYVRNDMRVFPVSNSSKEVREKLLDSIKSAKFIKETVLRIEKETDCFRVITDMNSYRFNKLVCAIGGHGDYEIIKRLGIKTTPIRPALTAYVSDDRDFSKLMGTSLKNVYNKECELEGDLLFTHFGVSGPLIYQISSIKAYENFPFKLHFDLYNKELDLQSMLNNNPHKQIRNLLSGIFPKKVSDLILEIAQVEPETESHKINSKMRDRIITSIRNFEVEVKSSKKDGETVNAGGVDLDTINSKTMESKTVKDLYFCGEVIDVDGFCGGFNLQNCWATGYICAKAISGKI